MTALLHPALRLLFVLQLKASWRRFTRSARTFRGVVRLVLTIAVLALTFAPMIVFSFYRETPDPAIARAFLEPGMFLFTVLTLLGSGPDNGIFFTPSEVDFLFPAPFHRRELLLYRLGHQARAALFGALFLSVAPAPFVPHWGFGYLGIALVLQFIQLVSILLSLVTSVVGQAAYTRGRKLALAILGLVTLAAIVQVVSSQPVTGVFDIVGQLTSTSPGRVLLAPFKVFSRMITAQNLFPQFVGWGVAALAINAAMVVIALRLDTDFYERSIAISEKVARAMERARRGQAFMNLSNASGKRWRLPMPRRLRGAGPIAWRQAISALRGSRAVLYVVIALTAGAAFIAYTLRDDGSGFSVTGLVFLSLFMLPQMLQFDFRGDIERIDFLKSLPASAGAIAVGELIVPIVFATLIEWALVISTGLLWTDLTTVLIACAFAPAANLILFALENMVFLHYPRRTVTGTPFQAPARQMLMNFIKFMGIGFAGGVTALTGVLAYWIFGGSMVVGFCVAWLVAAGIGLALLPLVARAFKKLDPGLETIE